MDNLIENVEDTTFLPANKASAMKPRKKKTPLKDPAVLQVLGDGFKRQKSQKKAPKRGSATGVQPMCQQENLNADSLWDSEYRSLSRKYLLLEEERGGLEKELKEVEDDVRALEEQKLSLLDKLVILEGLIDPSELQHHGQRLP